MSEPVRWKWKKKPKVGLKSVMSSLQPGTLASFCEGHHDFLRLPKLMGTLCNHDYHVKQIKLALNQVALLRGTYEMHKSVARRKGKSRIKNVVPGPRSGLGSFVVEHCWSLWLYAVGADQAINVHHW